MMAMSVTITFPHTEMSTTHPLALRCVSSLVRRTLAVGCERRERPRPRAPTTMLHAPSRRDGLVAPTDPRLGVDPRGKAVKGVSVGAYPIARADATTRRCWILHDDSPGLARPERTDS
jgi:hypothetical protein